MTAASGRRVRVVPGAGLYADGHAGRARRVVDDDRGYLLGVIFVGPGVEELINSATLVRGRPRSDQPALARRPMFPPISEAWLRLLEAYRS
jgi:dihydrolipoamide dehydrogenase